MSKSKGFLKWAPVLLGLLVMLTPYWIAPVCANLLELKSGSLVYMKCHYAAQVEILLGGILILVGLLLFTRVKGKSLLGPVIALLGLSIIFVPQQWLVGVCLNADMSCRTTLWWLVVEGLLAILVGWLVWRAYRQE